MSRDLCADVVMQPRCVHCLREQYALAVYAVSHGEHPCVWCGTTAPVYRHEHQYRAALSHARRAEDQARATRSTDQ